MDNLTEKERQAVEELKKRTIDEMSPPMLKDEFLFYRFSKARNFNIDDAEIMLRNSIAFSKEIDFDTLLTDYKPPEVLEKYLPINFVCFDKEGRVVRLIDCVRADLNGLWSVTTKKELAKYSTYIMLKDREKLFQRGGNLSKPMFSAIFDFEDFSYRTAISFSHLPYLYYLLKLYIDHCPEMLGKATVINAPSYFSVVYAVFKPILPSSIIQRLRIYGKDGWKEFLSEEINPDDLPAYLGGNRTDPDGNPLCETFIRRGQPIPRSYYRPTAKQQ